MIDHVHDPIADGASGQDGDRVAKVLARAGVASRREVERLIGEGRVALNGQVLDTPAVKVSPGDILTVDGAVVEDAEPTRLFRYHKPVGLITTTNDPQGRPDVFASLPAGLPRLISVGRLDIATEGLLLLTNDGELARALELPKSGWIRRYRARALGSISQDRLDSLKAGVTVEGVQYGPVEARIDKAAEGRAGANVWISVAVAEGKNREVRRLLEHVGLKVNRLIRVAYGPFALGDLGLGAVAEVGPRVLAEQLAGYLPEGRPRYSGPLFTGGGDGEGRRPGSRAGAGRLAEASLGRGPAGTTGVAPLGARPYGTPGAAEDRRRTAAKPSSSGREDRPRKPPPPRAARPMAEDPRPPKKAGWAKAKPRTGAHAAKGARAPRREPVEGERPRTPARPRPAALADRGERPAGGYGKSARPGAKPPVERPKFGGPSGGKPGRASPRSGPPRAGADRPRGGPPRPGGGERRRGPRKP